MALEFKKSAPVELRTLGLDEKWLQDQIQKDPSILGLGELDIAGKEHQQPTGGRIDFLMYDTDDDTYYEIEVMLGALDESHIIRTIEYWDIERQRRPQSEHRAVIVAEQITSRFFNVLRLLNRAVPLIAVQLSVFRFDDAVVLHPVKVLDVVEEIADSASETTEQVDRGYWEDKVPVESLAMMDKIVSLVGANGAKPRLTYNRGHIAMATTGYNFCWLHPRKSPGRCHFEFRVPAETRDSVVASLEETGIDASPRKSENVTVSINAKKLDEHADVIANALKQAEEASRA